MSISKQEKYNALKLLIKERQEKENKQALQEHLDHSTTINYQDIDGNSLLHYAAALGRLKDVEALLDHHVLLEIDLTNDDGETPIESALKNDQFEVVRYLYDEGADCAGIRIQACPSEHMYNWYRETAHHALNEAFPDPEDLSKPKVTNQFFKKTASEYDALALALEIGDFDFLDAVKETHAYEFSRLLNQAPPVTSNRSSSLIRIATCAGHRAVVKWLLKNGVSIRADGEYQGSVLIDAVSKNSKVLTELLLAKGAKVNDCDNTKESALFKALRNGNLELIKLLVEKEADIKLENIDGDTLLHIAAMYGNLDCLIYLLSFPELASQINKENFYGMTPLDYALYNKKEQVIQYLHPDWTEADIQQHPKYGKLPPKINQHIITKHLKYFIRSHYGSTQFIGKIGLCNALDFLSEWYAHLQKLNKQSEYYTCLEKVSQWRGDEAALDQEFPEGEGLHVKSLRDLFRYWVSIIPIFKAQEIGEFVANEPLNLTDRKRQFEMVSDSQESPNDIYSYEKDLIIYRTAAQVEEILGYIRKLPPFYRFELRSARHVTSGHVDQDRSVPWYDSNSPFQMRPCSDVDTLYQQIRNYMYILPGDYGKFLKFSFRIFTFGTPPGLSNNRLFKDEELPKNDAELTKFVSESPNAYTPLHIAIITQSVADIDAILKKSYVSIFATDSLQLSPIDYAFLSGNQKIIERLLDEINYDLSGQCQAAVIAYRDGNIDLLNSIMTIPNLVGFEELLLLACKRGDEELVRRLVFEKKVKLDSYEAAYYVTTPLVLALKGNYWSIAQFLIENGADVLTAGEDNISPLEVAIKNKLDYNYLIEKSDGINFGDRNGNAALHHAARSGDFEMMKSFIEKGALKYSCNEEGKQPLVLLLESDCDFATKQKAFEFYINHPTFQPFIASVVRLAKDLYKTNFPHEWDCETNKAFSWLETLKNENNKQSLITLFNRYQSNANHRKKRSALEAIIEKRQAFERNHPNEPYISHPTTMQYQDMLGNTLLHYDAMLGDLKKVKQILNEKININIKNENAKTPLAYAIANDRYEVADYLYSQGASCKYISIRDCKSEKMRQWYMQVAETALHAAFPDPKNLTKPSQKNQFFGKKANAYDALALACEIGDMNFLSQVLLNNKQAFLANINYVPTNPSNSFTFHKTLLCKATHAGQTEIVKWLRLNGASIHSRYSYQGSALIEAVTDGNNELTDLFLEQVVSANAYDRQKENALFAATRIDNLELIKKLIKKGAAVDIDNYCGNNLIHCAAESGSVACLQYFLTLPELSSKQRDENFFGFRPLELALWHKHDQIIRHLKPDWKEEHFQREPSYGVIPPKINQFTIRQRLKYFMRTYYGDDQFFENGSCNGLDFLSEWYNALCKQNKSNEYFLVLEKISLWNGDEAALEVPFDPIEIPHAKNLKDLFNYWISTINIFQASGLYKEVFVTDPLRQNDRERQFKLISQSGYSPSFLYVFDNLLHTYNLPMIRTQKAVKEMLGYMSKLPPDFRFELSSGIHISSGHIDGRNQLYWYDSNGAYRMAPCADVESLFKRLLAHQYIWLGSDLAKLFFYLKVFYFGKKPDMSQCRLFEDSALPKNYAEFVKFKEASCHSHTPLHVAVLFQSMNDIDAILATPFHFLYKDAQGLTPLEYAFISGNQLLINKLLTVANFNLRGDNTLVNLAYLYQDKELLNAIVDTPNLVGFERLLVKACTRSDEALVKKLILGKKVNLEPGYIFYHTTPLVAALQAGASAIVQLLLENGASILEVGKDKLSALEVSIRDNKYFDEMIARLDDINQENNKGETAQHFAAKHGRFDLMKSLTAKGARTDIDNKEGECPLALLISSLKCTDDIKKEAIKFYCQDPTFKPSTKFVIELFTKFFYLLDDADCKALLDKYVNVKEVTDARFVTDESLLYKAIAWQQVDRVKILLAAGATPTLGSADKPPLVVAVGFKCLSDEARQARFDIVQALLEAGADPYQCDSHGRNAFDMLVKVEEEGRAVLEALLIQATNSDAMEIDDYTAPSP